MHFTDTKSSPKTVCYLSSIMLDRPNLALKESGQDRDEQLLKSFRPDVPCGHLANLQTTSLLEPYVGLN